MADPQPNALQRPDQRSQHRPADHLSATDEDQPNNLALEQARSSPPKAPFDVFTPKGFRPFYPPGPEPIVSSELVPDNPFNPRGGPSQSLPQQATPLTSLQDVMTVEEMADDALARDIAATQDGLAPDDPRNPRGTPDYIVEGPSPRSNPEDQQHDGRLSHEDQTPGEAKRYWEGDAPNG
jgi:hypothetical protein